MPDLRARKLGYALLGLLVAVGLGSLGIATRGKPRWIPAAYRIPLVPGGTALRLAMVHDVLHERYARHSPAFYRERTRRAEVSVAAIESKLSEGLVVNVSELVAFDDFGMGLDQLGQSATGLAALRRKQALLSERWPLPESPPVPKGRVAVYQQMIARGRALQTPDHALELAWYRTYANLGTALVHANAPGLFRGEPEAVAACREALGLIERALEINPQAHFGREVWQAHLIRFFLRASEEPSLLRDYDCLGQSLKAWAPYDSLRRRMHLAQVRGATGWSGGEDPQVMEPSITPEQRLALRRGIPRIGEELTFSDDFAPYSYPVPYTRLGQPPQEETGVPFDEPVLAILGMWMLGGGPNPHFALALGGTMERLGQRQLAYAAYSRAIAMGERFSPDPALRDYLVEHCEARRLAITGELGSHFRTKGNPIEPDALEAGFQRELARGLAYQGAQAEFEAAAIRAGSDVTSRDFLNELRASQGSLATRPGREDAFALKPRGGLPLGVLLLLAAVGAWAGLGLERLLRGLRRSGSARRT